MVGFVCLMGFSACGMCCVFVGCFVWMDALFGWVLCLIGCFVRRDVLFGGEVFV